MENDNKKIITLAFVIAGLISWLTLSVLLEAFAGMFGPLAKLWSQDAFKHGVPVGVGALVFVVLQFNAKIGVWADEVVVEIRKVVWPSRKDTTAMTIVCCVMLVLAGVMLGLFDLVSSNILKLMVN